MAEEKKALKLPELIAIALGGMVGGGIFSILGVSVAMVKNLTPVAIMVGGLLALLAAYSYVKLGIYYKEEGATYSFFKKTFPKSPFSASFIGWFVVFGYISTLALYAYTFASYAISDFSFSNNILIRKGVALGIIWLFALINIWSVHGMGKIQDVIVYTKIVILVAISGILIFSGKMDMGTFLHQFAADAGNANILNIFIVASTTFVAFEGFQLIINAVKEMPCPDDNIGRSIYIAISIAIILYVLISVGALMAIPAQNIIKNKEYALAAGAGDAIGKFGEILVIGGAILATSSAISGTIFGSSRQMAAIADDGYLPSFLSQRKGRTAVWSIIIMAIMACLLVVSGGLEVILEFGSITFLLVSFLMAYANYKIKDKTNSSGFLTISALTGLACGGGFILYYEISHKWEQMIFIGGIYLLLIIGAWFYTRFKKLKVENEKLKMKS